MVLKVHVSTLVGYLEDCGYKIYVKDYEGELGL